MVMGVLGPSHPIRAALGCALGCGVPRGGLRERRCGVVRMLIEVPAGAVHGMVNRFNFFAFFALFTLFAD